MTPTGFEPTIPACERPQTEVLGPATTGIGCSLKCKTVLSVTLTAYSVILIRYSKKGKSVPLQAWSGPEGSRELRFPDYMTTAQDGGKVVSLKKVNQSRYRPGVAQRVPGS